MRPSSGGVQFFDFVEEHRASVHETASTVAKNFGYTAAATTGTPTAARRASGRGDGGRPAKHAVGTVPATRDEPITVTSSAPTALASGIAAWGIMVPKS